MIKLQNGIRGKIILALAVTGCIAIMVLSAVAASSLYRPSEDGFSSQLTENLALLCRNSEPDISETQLEIIRQAEIKSIRYGEDEDGNRIFFARLQFAPPANHSAVYTGEPDDYLKKTVEKMSDAHEGEECDVYGLCSDNTPVVDLETIGAVSEASARAWHKETLSGDLNLQYAIIDALIPEPFQDRVVTEGGPYNATYTEWLDQCSACFASEGLTVTTENGQSGEQADIRKAMENIITPYLCSVRNITVSPSEERPGILTITFDSLDIISTITTAKKPSFSAINKLAGVYSAERTLKMTVDVDIASLAKDGEKMKLPVMTLIKAITKFGSTIGYTKVKIKTPEAPQVIEGKSTGQWPIEFKRAKGDGNIIVNILRIDDSGDESSVMKLFLTDGGSITVCLSKGRYRMNYAVGTTYYGNRELFGNNGIYMRDNDNVYDIPSLDISSITVAKQSGESLDFIDYLLRQQSDPSLIDKNEF
jgi:hypothetical protein